MNHVTKTTKMETESQFEMSVSGHQTTRLHIPESGNLHIHSRHSLKFRVSLSLAEA
jgi:hypothetical protein